MPGVCNNNAPSGGDAFDLGRAASAMSAIPLPGDNDDDIDKAEDDLDIVKKVMALGRGQEENPSVKPPGLSDDGRYKFSTLLKLIKPLIA